MPYEACPQLLLVPALAGCAAGQCMCPSASARTYLISYRLKLATLCYGEVTDSFFVSASRRFDTDELNVILAELYGEVGPAPHLLGLEILTITRLFGDDGSRAVYPALTA